MRRRLAIWFIALAFGMCALSYVVGAATLIPMAHRDELEEADRSARVAAVAIATRLQSNRPVTEHFLGTFRSDDQQIRYHVPGNGRADLVSAGPDFDGTADPSRSDDLWASERVEHGTVTVSQSRDVVWDLVLGDRWVLLVYFGLLGAISVIAGWVMARSFSAPFRQLAEAASAHRRGRFDLDLPVSSLPEVRAIAAALDASAVQVAERIAQEQSFAEHASHVLRTPLTSLRLELDDLALTGALSEEARDTLARCIGRIDTLDAVTGELVQLARRRPAAGASKVAVRELAEDHADRWTLELAHHERTLTCRLEGDAEATYTPGPIEHLQELLLVDLLHRSRGEVVLDYTVDGSGTLRIRVTSDATIHTRGRRREPGSTFLRARAVATALGGRLEGEQYDAGIELVLPRR